MKGLAAPHTLTGRVQRQLEDWTSASTVMARLGLPPKQYRTVQALLERLVKEGRAVKCEENSTYRLVLPEGDDAIVGGITRSPSGSIGAATGALLESAQDSPLPAGRSAPQPASPQLSLPLSGRLREEAA